jgi:hypothetical protein
MKKIFMFILLAAMSKITLAQEVNATTCKDGTWKIHSPLGLITEQVCKTSEGSPQKWATKYLLEGKPLLLRYGSVSLQIANKDDSLIVLQDFQNPQTGCPDRMFLMDLTGTAPRVFSFGVKNACNEYHWAKWSNKKRSVIALKFNVQFTYLNGKLIPPEDTDGDKFGTPLGYEAPTPATPPTPFVQELALPKSQPPAGHAGKEAKVGGKGE